MSTKKYEIVAKCYDKRGRLLSTGINSYTKTHTIQARFANKVGMVNKQYLHAEIACIISARGAKIHSIHVSRITNSGCLHNARPCPICMSAISAYGVEHVYYSDANGCIVEMNMKA